MCYINPTAEYISVLRRQHVSIRYYFSKTWTMLDNYVINLRFLFLYKLHVDNSFSITL